MCSAFVVVFFHRIAVGVVAGNLMSDFNVTGTVLGGLGAMYFYTYSFMQIPSGVFADVFGARKTVTAGTLVAGIGSIIFGTASTIYVAYIGRLIVGFGVSVVFISILKVQSQWFKESEFGTISGLTTLIGNGGGLLAGTPLAIAVAYFNWRVVFISIGIVSIVISVLNYIIVRNKPEDIGLPRIAPAVDSDGNNVADRHRILDSIKTVAANKHTWLAFLIMAGLSGSILSFNGMWGIPYLMDVYGFEKTRASSYITASMAGLMIGSFLSGAISDRMGSRKKPLLAFSGVNLVLWVLLIMWNAGKPPIEVLYPLLFAQGLSAGGFVIVLALGKELNPPQVAGISLGTTNLGGFLSCSILQLLMGYILDLNWGGTMVNGIRVYSQSSYATAFALCTAVVFVAVICIVFIKETNCRNIYN